MPYLFQVSIGPVQTFIKGARRTRDLKFNSSFLSRLAATAASTIEADPLAVLIFPATEALQSGDVSNKVLAYIQSSPKDAAREVEEAIHKRIEMFWNDVLSRIGERTPFNRQGARQQIDDIVEFIWAAVDFDKQKDPYNEARNRLEALIAARKNTRDFAPVRYRDSIPQPSAYGIPKSSIDGTLECVIPKEAYPPDWSIIEKAPDHKKDQLKKVYKQMSETLRAHFDAGPHEKLSGVDLLKRLGPINEDAKTSSGDEGKQAETFANANTQRKNSEAFPSTSHMAALPFLYALNTLARDDRGKAEEWKERYISTLERIGNNISFALDILPKDYRANAYWEDIFSLDIYDGALLFPERFPDVIGDAQIFQEARTDFQEAVKILDDFLREIQLRPSPYYVLLAADGDAMGSTIDWQAREGMEKHQALSCALAHFAGGVAEVVKNHAGVCIYAGGDDVLALLPLHEPIQCAQELADSFYDTLKPFQNEQGTSPTLSVGLAIVHHLHPLGDALEIARAAESRAKSGGKNALAITVQKRGGPPCEVGGRWDVFDTRLDRQIELCQQGIIPSGMAYELEEIALRLEPEPRKAADQQLSPLHVQYAALRVFQRKLDEAGREKNKKSAALALYALKCMIGLIGLNEAPETPDQAFDALKKALGLKDEQTQLLDELRVEVRSFDQLQPVHVGQLADELVVARLFADAQHLVSGRKQGGKV
jgi:CRISPR-associated protein Cmr2